MFDWLKSLFKKEGPREVPGAAVFKNNDGRVVYNMLDPWMQKFMGQCVGAVKKSGIRAKGTGQFSILLGNEQRAELRLDKFWSEYSKNQDPAIFDQVAAHARQLTGK
ncbi:MAG TPA: hypothetical protein VKX17_04150 [Planctomycetota bacterium]|nr:hypothetical protein [Planctomycetota bacterium]